jgi:hypothetical protein
MREMGLQTGAAALDAGHVSPLSGCHIRVGPHQQAQKDGLAFSVRKHFGCNPPQKSKLVRLPPRCTNQSLVDFAIVARGSTVLPYFTNLIRTANIAIRPAAP